MLWINRVGIDLVEPLLTHYNVILLCYVNQEQPIGLQVGVMTCSILPLIWIFFYFHSFPVEIPPDPLLNLPHRHNAPWFNFSIFVFSFFFFFLDEYISQLNQVSCSFRFMNTFYHAFTEFVITNRCLFYQHGFTLIPARISNYTHFKAHDEITYSFQNFNGLTVEV